MSLKSQEQQRRVISLDDQTNGTSNNRVLTLNERFSLLPRPVSSSGPPPMQGSSLSQRRSPVKDTSFKVKLNDPSRTSRQVASQVSKNKRQNVVNQRRQLNSTPSSNNYSESYMGRQSYSDRYGSPLGSANYTSPTYSNSYSMAGRVRATGRANLVSTNDQRPSRGGRGRARNLPAGSFNRSFHRTLLDSNNQYLHFNPSRGRGRSRGGPTYGNNTLIKNPSVTPTYYTSGVLNNNMIHNATHTPIINGPRGGITGPGGEGGQAGVRSLRGRGRGLSRASRSRGNTSSRGRSARGRSKPSTTANGPQSQSSSSLTEEQLNAELDIYMSRNSLEETLNEEMDLYHKDKQNAEDPLHQFRLSS